MKNHRYRAFINGEMKDLQAIFWSSDFTKITEIRFFNSKGDIDSRSAVDGGIPSLEQIPIMQSTGFLETGSERFVFEGDIVEVEYQYGKSLCVVEWCDTKYGLVLNPVKGEKPKHKPHFRIPGKKSIIIVGNTFENSDLLS